MPEGLTQTKRRLPKYRPVYLECGRLHFEWWPASDRNGGRLSDRIPAGINRNQHMPTDFGPTKTDVVGHGRPSKSAMILSGQAWTDVETLNGGASFSFFPCTGAAARSSHRRPRTCRQAARRHQILSLREDARASAPLSLRRRAREALARPVLLVATVNHLTKFNFSPSLHQPYANGRQKWTLCDRDRIFTLV